MGVAFTACGQNPELRVQGGNQSLGGGTEIDLSSVVDYYDKLSNLIRALLALESFSDGIWVDIHIILLVLRKDKSSVETLSRY